MRSGVPCLDPRRSLGWNSGPLDGLSCYLRCVEAILRSRGYSPVQVARGLARPLDLLLTAAGGSSFPCCRVEWTNRPQGVDNWDGIRELLSLGEHLILMPNRYFWPGDEFEGRREFHDHMVVLTGLASDHLEMLDIDAPAADGYRRRIRVDARVRSACTRYARVFSVAPWTPASPEALGRALIARSTDSLADDVASMEEFAEEWTEHGMDEAMLRALHVLTLGELQPQMFLLASVLEGLTEPRLVRVRERGLEAASRAQQLGLVLLAAHRRSEGATYELARHRFLKWNRAAAAALEAMSVLGPPGGGTPAPPPGRMRHRLERLAEWCFAPALSRTRPGVHPNR